MSQKQQSDASYTPAWQKFLVLCVVLVQFYQPVHAWLHAHTLGFWAGVFVGSLLELAIILAARWTWHRYGLAALFQSD